ncbi:helix-turn-helix domain-containing protein, partial [Alistipes onderdonkii]
MRIKYMDGYTLTEKMRKARRRNRLTATEQALFHELVAVCNSEGWEDVFSCSNIELCCALNIDEKTLVRARLSLINAGLIYYKSGKSKRIVGLYSFEKAFENSIVSSTAGNIPVDKPAQETVDAPANLPTNMGTNQPTNAPDYIYKTKIETKLKDNIG